MLENIQAVIFDLDGTLVDSMWVWKKIDVEYLGKYGLSVPEKIEHEIEGMGFTETAVYFQKRFALADPVEKIMEDWLLMARDKYREEVPLKQGAAAYLQMLRQRGMKIGIASSNSRELIEPCLQAHGVRQCFDCVITSCDVQKGKPAPDVYLRAAELLGAKPEHCLVFEDVPMGILAGKNAGMTVCAVRDSFSLDQTERIRELADYYIASYEELLPDEIIRKRRELHGA